MLFARRNQAFVDDEEQSKKIVFERTLKWVKRLYPEENKEVALTPVKISSQLQYGYDSLFESWRSAVEQLLSANYNDELTTQRNHEVVRKYNQLSSYIKNIMNMNQATPEDEERIKRDFDGMRGKLTALKNLAVTNSFHDEKDIVEMVDKINETTGVKKSTFDKVSAESPDMVDKIEDKTTTQQKLKYIQDNSVNVLTKIDPTKTSQADKVVIAADAALGQNIVDFTWFTATYNTAAHFADLRKTITDAATKNSIVKAYYDIKEIQTKLTSSVTSSNITQIITDIKTGITSLPIETAKVVTLLKIDDATIKKNVDAFIATQQTDYELKINEIIQDQTDEKKDADDKMKAMTPLVAPKRNVIVTTKSPHTPKLKDPGERYIKDPNLTDPDNMTNKIQFLTEKKAYHAEKKDYEDKLKVYGDSEKLFQKLKSVYKTENKQQDDEYIELKTKSDDAASEMKSKKKLLSKSPAKWNLESVKICAEIRTELDEYTKEVGDIEKTFVGAFAVDAATGFFKKDPFVDEKEIETNYEFVNDSTKTLEDITLKIGDLFTLTPATTSKPSYLRPKALFPGLKTDRDLFHQLYDKKKGTSSKKSSGIYYHFNNYQKANAKTPQSMQDYVRMHIK